MRAMVVAAVAAMGAMACGGGSKQLKPGEEGPTVAAYWGLSGPGGVIVAESPEATVPMRVLETGETYQLADGEALQMKELFAGEGLGRAEAQILAREQIGVVPNTAVLVEHRVVRIPGSDYLVFTAVAECSPGCVSGVWVLGKDGWRAKVTDAAKVAPSHVAVHPYGRAVAIGAHGLWIVDVPEGKVRHWEQFTSPTYDAHGVLYVRGVGPDDAVYEMGEFGNGVLLHTEPGSPPAGVRDEPAPDAAPIRLEDDGKTVVATFVRKGKPIERRIAR